MPMPFEAAQSYDSGFISGSLTSSVNTKNDVYLSVFVDTSGTAMAKEVYVNMGGVSFGPLVLPSASNTSAVNFFGPNVSGTSVTNKVGYFNAILPESVQINASGTSAYRILTVGR